MRELAKHVLDSYFPTLLDLARALRNRWRFGRRFSTLRRSVKEVLYGHDQAIRVMTGPFEGMKYIDAVVWGSITPKWLGSYESELSPVIDEIGATSYARLVDIGCAEGYYAVGLARLMPHIIVFAFDNDLISRWQLSKLAALNDVEHQLVVGRQCSHETLRTVCKPDTVVICDVEGYERTLLDPCQAPELNQCDILVEVHEYAGAATESTLRGRFANTHLIRAIDAADRRHWCDTHDSLLPQPLVGEATNEHRSNGQRWLWLKSKQHGVRAG